MKPLKIIYMGSNNPLSILPFQVLLNSPHQILSVFTHLRSVKQQDPRFNIKNNQTIRLSDLAFQHDISVIPRTKDLNKMAQSIQQQKPDIIIVSCFSTKLSQQILKIPTFGCFNLHPSLLPAYRGPDPLFWQCRDGHQSFGITLHKMEASLDTGAIVSQRSLKIDDGVSILDMQNSLGFKGAALVKLLIDQLMMSQPLCTTPQNEKQANYQGFSTQKDYLLSTHWTVERLFNFVKATLYRGNFYQIETENQRHTLKDVALTMPSKVNKDFYLPITCKNGTLYGVLAPQK